MPRSREKHPDALRLLPALKAIFERDAQSVIIVTP
jgi:hypothetical protein